MIAADEDALICDLAETYGIFNYRALPVKLLATLSSGLREDSRIRMRLNDQLLNTETMLFMSAVDSLKLLVWMNSKDGANNTNRPKSLLAELIGEKTSKDVKSFESGEEFEWERKRLLGEEC